MPLFFWISSVVLAVIAADYVYRRYASGRIRNIIENVPTFAAVPVSPVPDRSVFRIPTADGLSLEACLHLPANDFPHGLIVFCPELNGNHWTALHYGQGILDSGFAVLAFDFRNQGASDQQAGYRPIHWVTEAEQTDIDAVLSYIAADDTLRNLPVGLFGVSRGGSAALVAACRHPEEVSAVVTDSGYSAMSLIRQFMYKFSRFVVPDWFFRRLPLWHIDWVLWQSLARSERRRQCRYVHLEQERRSYSCPTLMISGRRDSYATPEVTQRVAQLINQPECVWLVDKARHNKSRQRNPQDYDARVISHFRKYLVKTSLPHRLPNRSIEQDNSSRVA